MTDQARAVIENSYVCQNMDDIAINLVQETRKILPELTDCINPEHMNILSNLAEQVIDRSISFAQCAVNTLVESHVEFTKSLEIPSEVFIHAGFNFWKRYVELFNMERFDAINTNNGAPYLTLEPTVFLCCIMGLPQETRTAFIPTIEQILLDMFAEAMAESASINEIDALWTPNSENTTPPSGQYEFRDKVFEDLGMSELIRTFQELGTYRPDAKYDDSKKIKLHERINELMDVMFRAGNEMDKFNV